MYQVKLLQGKKQPDGNNVWLTALEGEERADDAPATFTAREIRDRADRKPVLLEAHEVAAWQGVLDGLGLGGEVIFEPVGN